MIEAIAIGASAGGGEVLRTVLRGLSNPVSPAILVVQHVAQDASMLLVENLSRELALPVLEGAPGMPIEPGRVYIAPSGYHMMVEGDQRLALSVDPPVCFSRPSIDCLFFSAASVYREQLMAIILTGANSDGAEGLARACLSGALTVVQDPEEAEFPTMPRAALSRLATINSNREHQVLRAEAIAELFRKTVADIGVNRVRKAV